MRFVENDEGSRTERFVRVPKDFFENGLLTKLKPSEIKIYLAIFPSIKKIQELIGVNKNAICKATENIKKYGLIQKNRAPKAFKFKNIYRVIRTPNINFSESIAIT